MTEPAFIETGLHHCPECGAPLERVHRNLIDRWLGLFRTLERFHCDAPGCGWEGLLERPRPPLPERVASWRTRLLWFVLGLATAAAAVQGAAYWRARKASVHPSSVPASPVAEQSHATPAGEDFIGLAQPLDDGLTGKTASPLALRNDCAWGVPGSNRYRGTVTQALVAARLPPEVVRQVAEKAQRGWRQEELLISRDGIRSSDGKRDYGTKFLAMAFGETLCFNTRVNFVPGHVEVASLYTATDSRNRSYKVVVPDVCNNVAVLGERGEIEGRLWGGERSETPEPATWAMLGLGLAALGLVRRGARRTRRP